MLVRVLVLVAAWAACWAGLACSSSAAPIAAPPARRTDRDDATTLAVISRAAEVDGELARLAVNKAHADGVKELASMLVNDDDVILAATASLMATTAPATTLPALVPLENAAAASQKRLEGLAGDDFDRAFVDGEVAFDRALLPWLDPAPLEDPRLARLATELRAAIQTHLEHAQIVAARFAPR